MIEFFKILLIGIVEGITEWIPVSSTGHMILLDELIQLKMTPEFKSMFLVVIQFGAILAVVGSFWSQLWPFSKSGKKGIAISKRKMVMWFKIIVACIPAAIVGILLDDWIDEHFYNYKVVAISLIIFGIFFILIENKKKETLTHSIDEISYKEALIIGLFQVLAAVFPGTSRSGATILGGLLIGLDRVVATEFTFFLAVPVMLGASLLKIMKFGLSITLGEVATLLFGMLVAFIVSALTIKLLLDYVKKHDFKPFGYYRIVLGIVVLLFFSIFR
ncbi:MAG: undecaprenyl-diphosphate phosphatase [Tissierellia bacterium]|nr:undecaprenyl-diphosphate phosphatase [Tissierellia bacterium]